MVARSCRRKVAARLVGALALCLMSLLPTAGCRGCGPAAREKGSLGSTATGASGATRPEGLGEKSRFGLDYVFPFQSRYREEQLARALASTGAGWVNFAEVRWGSVEPRPPSGGSHDYRWDELDEAVRVWQRHGFRLVFTLRIGKGWFAGPIRHQPAVELPLLTLMLPHSDRLPAAEHLAAYDAWIGALVERYDDDGTADMPDLAAPVLHYQVGNEYSNPVFWTGTLADYATLLGRTARTIRAASPRAQIISNGIRWNDLFHADPDAAHFEERFAAFLDRLPSDPWRAEWRRSRAITEGTVALADSFDILDAGGNGPYPTASAGYLTWVRRELAKSAGSAAIWDLESRCEPRLVADPHTSFLPSRQIPDGPQLLKRLKTPLHRNHDRVQAWYRAEQARLLAQVFVTRFAAGCEKVFMGMPVDWDKTPAAWTTPNPFIGLLDRQGAPWPALRALQMLVSALDGFASAQRIAAPPGVELFQFAFEGDRPPVWVAWLVVERPHGLDDPLPRRRVALPKVQTPATARPIPTSRRDEPVRQVPAGKPCELELDPTPVVIRPQGAP